jgi:pyruvate/2-oxoglutarate dehydrogenase complex dihydrolipoamide dehydrogenase (E3) component
VHRAIADDEETGFVKIDVVNHTDRILGATIVAHQAGEMISEITLAMVAGIGLRRLAHVIHPYPTQAAAIRMAADAYNRALAARRRRWMSAWLRRPEGGA